MSFAYSISSPAVSTALRTMETTRKDMEAAQKRLATGLRVSSPLDNPAVFFKASALSSRAATLNSLFDNMAKAAGAIQTANESLSTLTSLVQSAQGLAQLASLEGTDATGLTNRTNYASQISQIFTQIDQLVEDSGYDGLNLLKGNSLNVVFNEKATSFLNLQGESASRTALGLGSSLLSGNLADNTQVTAATTALTNSLTLIQSQASNYSNSLAILTARGDFNGALIDLMSSNIDDMTLSNADEESALLTTLQTRLDLASQSISLSYNANTTALRILQGA